MPLFTGTVYENIKESMGMNNKTTSIDHYLKTIYQLQEKLGTVRCIDIANARGFSKPSITKAVATLKELGYLTINEHEIKLTENGEQEAIALLKKYHAICDYLTTKGISKNAASCDACTLEHSISEETYQQFLREIS